VKHILTSGGPNVAMEGLELIKFAKTLIDDVLIGAGINKDNAKDIIEATGINQLHIGTAV
jgi:copper homeostasis protein CutC